MAEDKAPKTPTLDLATLEEPADYIRIDGETYDLADARKFSLRQRAHVQRLMRRVDALEQKATADVEAELEPSEDDDREYNSRLAEICHIALPTATKEVVDRLATGQRAGVAAAFFARSLLRRGLLGAAPRFGGHGSSPTSSTSTPETPSGG